jgi:ornithine--oxo-acid transaminase
MMTSKEYMELEKKYGAHNYHPIPVVISKAQGIWVEDPEGKKYIDMLSAYSAHNQGHRHPKIIKAAHEQLDVLTLTSRAFYNDKLGIFLKKVCEAAGMTMALPMNTGAEAVETAIKTARKWGYKVKKVEKDKAEIIVFADNFHGRTTTIIGFSTDPTAYENYGPFTPNFKIVKYGDLKEVENAINQNTVAILVEPIQGEAGIKVPPAGFMKGLRDLATKNNVLLIADEIQTGLGRTGKLFCCDWDGVKPDMFTLGKALGGGIFPVSAVVADEKILGVFEPGSHGSTFGGNPLAAVIGIASLEVIIEEKLADNAREVGDYFQQKLRDMNSPFIKEVRGKGLLIGVEIKADSPKNALDICHDMVGVGILAKPTHDTIIRFAPPLVITKNDIDYVIEKIKPVFSK